MKPRELKYLAKAKGCEERATKMRRPEDREWQLILARAYRVLVESEVEAAAQRIRQERSRISILVGSPTAAPVSGPAAKMSPAGDPARAPSDQAHRAA
jgi:hypothetical protein